MSKEVERHKKIQNYANMFLMKYPNEPISEIIDKLKKERNEHNIDDETYYLILKNISYSYDLPERQKEEKTSVFLNRLGKILGPNFNNTEFIPKITSSDSLNISKLKKYAGDTKFLATLYKETKMYNNLNNMYALSGIYDPKTDNIETYVHPILAALFLPKIKMLENKMLIAQLANLFVKRMNKSPMNKYIKEEVELFNDLIQARVDVVCGNSNSPIDDFSLRSEIQNLLCQNVMKLRNGKYYGDLAEEFINKLTNCAIHKGWNMGSLSDVDLISKLLEVFSIEPILVKQMPINQMSYRNLNMEDALDKYNQPVISRRNILHLRLSKKSENETISISNAFKKKRTITVGPPVGTNVEQLLSQQNIDVYEEVIHIQGLLIVTIDRNMSTIKLKNYLDKYEQYKPRDYPDYYEGMSEINNTPVEFEDSYKNGDLKLRSVITNTVFDTSQLGVEEKSKNNPIYRQGTYVFILDYPNTVGNPNVYIYDPANAKTVHDSTGMLKVIQPPAGKFPGGYEEFKQIVRQFGTVFVYASNELQSSNLDFAELNM